MPISHKLLRSYGIKIPEDSIVVCVDFVQDGQVIDSVDNGKDLQKISSKYPAAKLEPGFHDTLASS